MPEKRRVVITSGTTWTVPFDFTTTNNTIEAWGAGAGGVGATAGGAGGGGGAYVKITNFSAAIGNTVPLTIGAGGSANTNGSNTTFANTLYTKRILAHGGTAGNTTVGGIGGNATLCVGDTIYAGGRGGNVTSVTTGRSGGGGGAGGNSAAGSVGFAANSTVNGANGGNGGATSGGNGGRGGYLTNANGESGARGELYNIDEILYGAGGGGGGGKDAVLSESGDTYYKGGDGGLFGGGGGGGNQVGVGNAGGNGGIIISYDVNQSIGSHISTFLHFGFN